MRRNAMRWAVVAGILVASGLAVQAQPPAATQAQPAAQSPPALEAPHGGRLHGVVKSGNIPLPGVTVTAQNTLTGKRYSTTTDITGAWSMTIPQNGRYVIRTQFAAFAPGIQEAVLNAASHDQTVNFELILASRAAEQQQQRGSESQLSGQAIRQLAGNGAQSLSLMSALTADTETQGGPAGASGAALPSIAGNSDFGGDSVAISGQSGAVSPLAGLDMDRVRDAMETMRAQGRIAGRRRTVGGGGSAVEVSAGWRIRRRRVWRRRRTATSAASIPASRTAPSSGSAATRRSTRSLCAARPAATAAGLGDQPLRHHLHERALPAASDQAQRQRYGLSHALRHAQSSPLDEYATVPTDAETGAATFPALARRPSADRASDCPNSYASGPNCLPFFPEPNLPGDVQNYHLLTTAQSNTTQAGARYMRSLGKNATLPGGGRGGFGGGGGAAQQNQGLRQSINFNYNWSHSASDNVNIFPQLGGKSSSDSNSVQAGYTVGYHKLTSIFNANWNRSTSQATNFFTNIDRYCHQDRHSGSGRHRR